MSNGAGLRFAGRFIVSNLFFGLFLAAWIDNHNAWPPIPWMAVVLLLAVGNAMNFGKMD